MYVRHRPTVLGNNSAEVIEPSEVLNRLAHADGPRSPTHRNANGVAMKLLNFRPFDPEYTASGNVGLHHNEKFDGRYKALLPLRRVLIPGPVVQED